MKDKKERSLVRLLTEIGVMAALGFVLDELQSSYSRGLFVNGGSIGIAMLCVIVVGYRRGFLAALATGIIMSLFDVATGPYILPGSFGRSFAQVLLDYILAYPVVALGALFAIPFHKAESKGQKILYLLLGCVVGGLAKFAVHYAAGAIFWADPSSFAWDMSWMNPYLYVFVYNIAYMGPCILASAAVGIIMFIRVPSLFDDPDRIFKKIKKEE